MGSLVLSIFPGIDLLGMAFEKEGFTVVRGPDLLWGGNILDFHPPASKFDGVIGGPPCQAHTRLRAAMTAPPKFGNLIPEFCRVVEEARPAWWLMENVKEAPIPQARGYHVDSFLLNNRWLGERQNRERRFTFGSLSNVRLICETEALEHPIREAAVLASEWRGSCGGPRGKRKPYTPSRPYEVLAELQGLPKNFLSTSPLTHRGKIEMVGNGVPLPMGRAVAQAVKKALEGR